MDSDKLISERHERDPAWPWLHHLDGVCAKNPLKKPTDFWTMEAEVLKCNLFLAYKIMWSLQNYMQFLIILN